LTASSAATAALAAIISIAAGASASAQEPPPPAPAPQPPAPQPPAAPTPVDAPAAREPVLLSDEVTFTRSANAVTRATAYAEPLANARTVGRLRLLTEDGFPEVYLLLTRVRGVDGRTWIHVRLPQRPNNVTGWVRRRALGPSWVVHKRLVVDRAALRVTLYHRGAVRFRAAVGIGAPGTPTPVGSFWIRERFHVSGNPLYGTRAMGTAAYSNSLTDWPGGGVVGLHGTSDPALIPGRPSHGCIRLRNGDMRRLYALTPVGTPVLIR
jgi:lipoprotein-anchoring transpeptidase ErfK/SrfK